MKRLKATFLQVNRNVALSLLVNLKLKRQETATETATA